MLINNYLNDRNNNFNLIRFIAASLVLYAHSFPLVLGKNQFDPFKDLIGMHLGEIAVDVFFLSSGFLIANSFFNKKSIQSFIWARFLRIYPALFVAVILSIFLGFYFTNLNFDNFFFNIQTIKYFSKNIFLFFGVEYYLPNVFLENPFSSAINDSLWTLPWEVKMYLYLILISYVITYINKFLSFPNFLNISFILIGILSVFLYLINHFFNILPENFIRLFSFFFIGVTYYILKDKIFLSKIMFFIFLLLLCISMINTSIFFIVYVCFLPYLVLCIAYLPKGEIRKFNNTGDYSYGIYIYAFPIQQSLIALFNNISVFYMIIISYLITILISILSWHLIEKKCLLLKNKIIKKDTIAN